MSPGTRPLSLRFDLSARGHNGVCGGGNALSVSSLDTCRYVGQGLMTPTYRAESNTKTAWAAALPCASSFSSARLPASASHVFLAGGQSSSAA